MIFYFDTSIWIDFFENRNEPNLPKGDWATALLNKVVEVNAKIIYSDHVLNEMAEAGYSSIECDIMFSKLRSILIFVEATAKQMGKAKDLAIKRNIPKGDALHALIARDNKAILVTIDHHFKELQDIIKPKKPQDLI